MARHLVSVAWPPPEGGLTLTTMAVNLVGSVLIGALVAVVTGPRPAPPWVRQLLGTGLLDGFATYSAHALDTGLLLASGRIAAAAAVMVFTLVAAVAGAALGAWAVGRPITRLNGGRRS